MLKNFYWALLNSGLPSMLAFFATIIIARIITPDQYLKIALLLSYFSLMNVVIDGGLSQKLLVRPTLTDRALEYVQSYVNFRLIIVIIFSILLMWLTKRYTLYSLAEGLLAFLLPTICAYNFKQNIVFNRRKLFKEKTILSCYAAIFSVGIAIIVTYSGHPTLGMLLLNILSVLILSLLMRVRLNEKIVPNYTLSFSFVDLRSINFAFFAQLTERADEFVKRATLEYLAAKLPTPVIARNESLLNSPIKLMNKAIERVILSNWGPLHLMQINKGTINKFLITSFVTSLLIFMLISIFGSYIISSLIGNRWQLENDIYSKIGLIISLKYMSSQLIHLIKSLQKTFSIPFYSNLASLIILVVPIFITDISLSTVLSFFILAYLVRFLITLLAGIFYARASA